MGIHIWKYLQITFCIFHYGFRAKMEFCVGTLTTKRVARLVTLYMRERMYATVSTVYFVVHTACYCMDAIHLNGNVWIKCLYAKVK